MKLLHGQTGRSRTWGERWFWLRLNAAHQIRLYLRNPPEDGGVLQPTLGREWGAWVVRPGTGWRKYGWITPPLHWTRAIPAHDEAAALDWWLTK